MTSKTLLHLTVAAFVSLFLTSALASTPITGDISFGGRIQLDTGNVNTANAITVWLNTHVEASDGDFSLIAPNTLATFSAPWSFDPSTPVSGFWSVGGFTFDLLTATILSQGSGFLNITGTGIVSSTNPAFSPTEGIFQFSTQNPSAAGTFSFSAAAEVPEPASVSVFLVGAGLLSLASFKTARSRRRDRA